MKQFAALLCVLLVCYSCTHQSNTSITYSISPITNGAVATLKVNASFAAEEDGETTLLFQNKAWGQDSLHNVLGNLKLLNAEATITKQKDSGWIVIKHPKNLKQLDFEYTITQDTQGELTTWDTYRPIVQPNYFHVFGHNFFMLPKALVETAEATFDVTIQWEGFSEDYALTNSFGNATTIQKIENTTETEFHTAVFVGGDFRTYEVDIKNNKVFFSVRGDWEVFQDTTMVNILEKTVIAQRNSWQDHTQAYFAVTMIPTIEERGSGFQGSGLTNSFAVNATNNKNLEVEGLVYLFNHELQHNWTGALIKNDNEEEQYWFSEGFTDYYTLKNIAKNNIYNLDERYFINEFNLFIKDLYTSPVKEMPNSELTYETFWSGLEGVQKLPYRRGALLAFYLDNTIQQDTNGEKSLDDVLLQFKDDALKNQQKITHPYFIETVNQFLKEDISPFFNTHIEEGTLYDLEAMFTVFGYQYEPTSKVFDLGFVFSEDRKTIASIDKTSEAYKEGLRAGDKLIAISYWRSETALAEFTVLRDGQEISVAYYPAREADIPLLINNEHNKKRLSF